MASSSADADEPIPNFTVEHLGGVTISNGWRDHEGHNARCTAGLQTIDGKYVLVMSCRCRDCDVELDMRDAEGLDVVKEQMAVRENTIFDEARDGLGNVVWKREEAKDPHEGHKRRFVAVDLPSIGGKLGFRIMVCCDTCLDVMLPMTPYERAARGAIMGDIACYAHKVCAGYTLHQGAPPEIPE